MCALGYVDAYLLYGAVHLRLDRLAEELPCVDPMLRPVVELFGLRRAVPVASLSQVFEVRELEDLLGLGVLLTTADGRLHTGGLVMVPFLGAMAFVPAPQDNPLGFLGDDTAALAVRVSPRPGEHVLNLYAGAGLLSLQAARLGATVVAQEEDEVANACLELNLAMNGVTERTVQVAASAREVLARDDTWDYVVATPPLLPFPADLSPDRPAPVWEVLSGLPRRLTPSGRGVVLGSCLGDQAGPFLEPFVRQLAHEDAVSVSVTVSSQTLLRRDSTIFSALSHVAARTAGLDVASAQKQLLQHLLSARADRMYLFFITMTRQSSPSPRVVINRPDRRGAGFWFR